MLQYKLIHLKKIMMECFGRFIHRTNKGWQLHEDVYQIFPRVSLHIARKSVPTLQYSLEFGNRDITPNAKCTSWKYFGLQWKVQLVWHSSPNQFKLSKRGMKCWCLTSKGLVSLQKLRSMTSLALPLHTKMTKSQSSRSQKKNENFLKSWKENLIIWQ